MSSPLDVNELLSVNKIFQGVQSPIIIWYIRTKTVRLHGFNDFS